MPSALLSPGADTITKFTNCRLVKGDNLVAEDLWFSSRSGKILRSQEVFYAQHAVPDVVIDLGGRIVSPGLIDVQLNGAFGVNFSDVPEDYEVAFPKAVLMVNRKLVRTGVTSYLPTLTSQRREVYHKLLPHLGPSGALRSAALGAESLGAHCEGPFLNPSKNGIHTPNVLIQAPNGLEDLEACYGRSNFPKIKMITAAPELGAMAKTIPTLVSKDIVFSIGHSEATYEDAIDAVGAGATMVTHLFNAMRPLHHRNPGIFGALGMGHAVRPSFGLIADGIHLHPTSVAIAFATHPEGCVLVTDAMHLVGLDDGVYEWTNGERIVKTGPRLTLEGSEKIAGSSITLIECVNNFLKWTKASVPQALAAVTSTPAKVVGLQGTKGCLEEDADADLCVFSEGKDGELVVDQVWKFGSMVFER